MSKVLGDPVRPLLCLAVNPRLRRLLAADDAERRLASWRVRGARKLSSLFGARMGEWADDGCNSTDCHRARDASRGGGRTTQSFVRCFITGLARIRPPDRDYAVQLVYLCSPSNVAIALEREAEEALVGGLRKISGIIAPTSDRAGKLYVGGHKLDKECPLG